MWPIRKPRYVLLALLLARAPDAYGQGIPIKSGSSSNTATVDASGNISVITPSTGATAGYVKTADGAGNATEVFESDGTNTLLVGRPTPIFFDPIESTAVDVRKWAQPASTMTMSQANGQITLNSGSATVSGNVARLTSWMSFPLYDVVGCGAYWTFRYSQSSLPTNQVTEMGLVAHTGTAAATSGVYFQSTTSGTFQAVRTSNSVDSTTAVTLTSPAITHTARIVRGAYAVKFYLDDVNVATMTISGASAGATTDSQVLPLSFRIYNSGAASAGNQLIIGSPTVFCDSDDVAPYSLRMVRMGSQIHAANANNTAARSGAQNPNWANSAAPASASLSNTAASYTTLGGQYQFAALATNETDWALFGYQNPTGQSLYVTSISADMCITGTASVNATNFFWAAATSATAVSLATADTVSSATIGPRRLPLFSMGHLAAAAQGTCMGPYVRNFDPPLVVEPTRFLHIILKSLNQAATASLVYRGAVGIHGFTGP